MQCKEIMQVIEAAYPRSAALDFDNVGLLAGRAGKEVNRVYLALDATDAVIDRAIEAGADMLITHHPLIFSPMKRVTDEDFIGRRVVKLIQSDIAYYAMHTNYDVLGMATLSEKILGIKNSQVLDVTMCEDGNEEGIGRVGDLEKPMTLEECCVYVKHKLKLGSLKVFGDMNGTVSRLAVSPGSGKSAVAPAIAKGADVLVNGDIIDDMKHFLEDKLPVLDVMTTPIVHPFQVI